MIIDYSRWPSPGLTVSQAAQEGLLEPLALDQLESYAAAIKWARTEGFISAPETSHAIAAVSREAEQAKEQGKAKVILFNWSGHGLMDLTGYEAYLAGKLTDHRMSEEDLLESIKVMDGLPKPSMDKSGK